MTQPTLPPSPTDPAIAALARRTHYAVEPLHTMIYFVPEAAAAYAAEGVTGGMRGYVASRSAAFGRVPAEVVTATFYNFSPEVITAAIPSVWEATTPERMLTARYAVADAALRRILGDVVCSSAAMAEAAELARQATTGCAVAGRPLFAAHAALPWPAQAHLQLWHAQTLLREHRGDGHIAALVLAGLSGLECAVDHVALGTGLSERVLQRTRGYSDEVWESARARLREQGFLDEAGGYTDAGRARRDAVEAATDAAGAAPYALLGPAGCARLAELAGPWSRRAAEEVAAARR